jgi:hypothetical protein
MKELEWVFWRITFFAKETDFCYFLQIISMTIFEPHTLIFQTTEIFQNQI